MKIDETLDSLIISIEKSDVYQEYQHVLKQVKMSDDINNLIKDIKDIQKQLVKEKTDALEIELENKKESLYSIPLYQDYLSCSEELNNLLKVVTDKLQIYIDDLNI